MQPSSYITNKLIAKKIIAEDEYELYQYSINALFEMTHGDSDREVYFCRGDEKICR